MSANPSQLPRPNGSKQDYTTPLDFLRAVTNRFGHIRFDLAASLLNRVVTACFTERENALVQDWAESAEDHGSLLWLNPPFADIAPWAEKCAAEMQRPEWPGGARILMLVPASVGANWWHEHVHPHAYVFGLSPRLTFGGCKDPYPKDLALCVYGACTGPGFAPWRWKP